MSLKKSHSLNRTLLIILGILLACLLTLNAQPINSATSIGESVTALGTPSETLIDQVEKIDFQNILKIFIFKSN